MCLLRTIFSGSFTIIRCLISIEGLTVSEHKNHANKMIKDLEKKIHTCFECKNAYIVHQGVL